MKRSTIVAVCFSILTLSGNSGSAAERIVSDANQTLSITIYNEDLALIKDQRSVVLENGMNELAWRNVSSRIRPETAMLRSAGKENTLTVTQQNYQANLLTPHKILEKHIGKPVQIIKTNPATGAETIETAIVLSATDGIVLKYPDRIETTLAGRLAYQTLPENLWDMPTLILNVVSQAAATQNVVLSYISFGLSWRADYVAQLNENEDTLSLSGWATLSNQSGANYPNARLQLVAGDINRVQNPLEVAAQDAGVMRAKAAIARAPSNFEQSSFSEMHIYTLPNPVTLLDQQIKQIALLDTATVPAIKELVINGAEHYYFGNIGPEPQRIKAGIFVEFVNKGEGLGKPLPRGIVRIYKPDTGGHLQLLGEDWIDHTPSNEKIRLRLGEAFDVNAEKKQISFEELGTPPKTQRITESSYQILIKNAKTQAVNVKVVEPIPGDWTIVSENIKHTRENKAAIWHVKVPAEQSVTLTYRVKIIGR